MSCFTIFINYPNCEPTVKVHSLQPLFWKALVRTILCVSCGGGAEPRQGALLFYRARSAVHRITISKLVHPPTSCKTSFLLLERVMNAILGKYGVILQKITLYYSMPFLSPAREILAQRLLARTSPTQLQCSMLQLTCWSTWVIWHMQSCYLMPSTIQSMSIKFILLVSSNFVCYVFQ